MTKVRISVNISLPLELLMWNERRPDRPGTQTLTVTANGC